MYIFHINKDVNIYLKNFTKSDNTQRTKRILS